MAVATEGHIQLGLLSEDAPGTKLLRLVAGFRREYPRIRCTLKFAALPQIQEDLIAERLSFAIVDRPSENDFIEAVTFGERKDVLVAAKNYVDERGPFKTVQALTLGDLILTPGEEAWLSVVQPAAVVPCHAAALELALAGAGVALLPDGVAGEAVARGDLVELAPTGFTAAKRPLTLLYRKRSARQLFESLFLEYFLEATGGDGPPPALPLSS